MLTGRGLGIPRTTRQLPPPTLAAALALGVTALAAVTFGCSAWFGVSDPAIPALLYLLVVVVAAAYTHLRVAMAASVASVLLLNYFFLPPRGTFRIAEPQSWIALFVLLVVSLIASQLSASARSRELEATARRDEVTRLFELSRDILLMTDSAQAQDGLARAIGSRFDLPYVAICLPASGGWAIHEAGRPEWSMTPDQLEAVFRDAIGTGESVAWNPRLDAHHTIRSASGVDVEVVPLRVAGRPVGLLAVAGHGIDVGALDAVAGVAAIAVERVHLLDERKNADLAREGAELKSTLLASLAHDLRTPLTAIRVATSNLQAGWASDAERQAQTDIVLTEVARLNRLFQNVLDMARIETEAVSADREWVTPEEIVEAALAHVGPGLDAHRLSVAAEGDASVHVDPRLTSAALAHLLENAAQYSPPGTTISIAASARDDGLRVVVEDEGPGVPAAELPRLFERFFRGRAAAGRPAGVGMGLAITRGLLAAEGGTVSGENRAERGARFAVAVPSPVRRVVTEP